MRLIRFDYDLSPVDSKRTDVVEESGEIDNQKGSEIAVAISFKDFLFIKGALKRNAVHMSHDYLELKHLVLNIETMDRFIKKYHSKKREAIRREKEKMMRTES